MFSPLALAVATTAVAVLYIAFVVGSDLQRVEPPPPRLAPDDFIPIPDRWPMAVAVTGWQLKVSAEATDFTIAVGASLLYIAIPFYSLRVFRLICMPGGLAAAHFRWPESSLRLLRSQLQRLSWIFLPAALAANIAARLDPLDAGWALGLIPFLIAMGAHVIQLLKHDRAFGFHGLGQGAESRDHLVGRG